MISSRVSFTATGGPQQIRRMPSDVLPFITTIAKEELQLLPEPKQLNGGIAIIKVRQIARTQSRIQ